MKFLKNHPFAVSAFFDRSTVLTFAIPKDQLLSFIPDCLELDTFQDKWAFIAVAMVQTKNLRPTGTPEIMGNNFFLIGYRIFVKYHTSYGKKLRGLYIIKSETNKKKMEFFGNIFTHYNYTTTDIKSTEQNGFRNISSKKSNFQLNINIADQDPDLPSGSPFNEWKEARRFAGPLPFTFTYDETDKSVLIIEGVRSNWKPKPIHVTNYQFEFLDNLNLKDIVLANAFEINDIPYQWKKGKKDLWK